MHGYTQSRRYVSDLQLNAVLEHLVKLSYALCAFTVSLCRHEERHIGKLLTKTG